MDADGDEPVAFLGQVDRAPERRLERPVVTDLVVRREQPHDDVAVARVHGERGQRNGRRRVAPLGLDEQVDGRHVRELLAHQVHVAAAGRHQHVVGVAGELQDPVVGGLDQGAACVAQVEELLGALRGGERPEALALAPGHDDGDERFQACPLCRQCARRTGVRGARDRGMPSGPSLPLCAV